MTERRDPADEAKKEFHSLEDVERAYFPSSLRESAGLELTGPKDGTGFATRFLEKLKTDLSSAPRRPRSARSR